MRSWKAVMSGATPGAACISLRRAQAVQHSRVVRVVKAIMSERLHAL